MSYGRILVATLLLLAESLLGNYLAAPSSGLGPQELAVLTTVLPWVLLLCSASVIYSIWQLEERTVDLALSRTGNKAALLWVFGYLIRAKRVRSQQLVRLCTPLSLAVGIVSFLVVLTTSPVRFMLAMALALSTGVATTGLVNLAIRWRFNAWVVTHPEEVDALLTTTELRKGLERLKVGALLQTRA